MALWTDFPHSALHVMKFIGHLLALRSPQAPRWTLPGYVQYESAIVNTYTYIPYAKCMHYYSIQYVHAYARSC